MGLKVGIVIGITVGSTIGGVLPYLWGDTDFLSPVSALFSILGGIVGVFVVLWIAKQIEV